MHGSDALSACLERIRDDAFLARVAWTVCPSRRCLRDLRSESLVLDLSHAIRGCAGARVCIERIFDGWVLRRGERFEHTEQACVILIALCLSGVPWAPEILRPWAASISAEVATVSRVARAVLADLVHASALAGFVSIHALNFGSGAALLSQGA